MMKTLVLFVAAMLVLVSAGCDETNHNDIQSNTGDSGIHVEAGAHGAGPTHPPAGHGAASPATTQATAPAAPH